MNRPARDMRLVHSDLPPRRRHDDVPSRRSASTTGRSAGLPLAGLLVGAAVGLTATAALLRPRYDFAGKVVLITGGSRGLGLVLARQLVRQGASVTVMARDADELARAAQSFPDDAPLVTVKGDVREPDDCAYAVATTVGAFGGLDVLINNAGVIVSAPLDETTQDDFHWLMDVHCWGTLQMTRAAAPFLAQRQGARIANICSIGGKVPVPHLAAYSASKFAQVGLSGVLGQELAAQGITVSTVCPGLMRVGSHLNARFRGNLKKEFAAFALASGLPGVSMSVERAARLILAGVRRGQTDVTVPFSVRQVARMADLAPNMAGRVLRWVAAALPRATDHAAAVAPTLPTRGADIGLNPVLRAAVVLSERAASRNNERRP